MPRRVHRGDLVLRVLRESPSHVSGADLPCELALTFIPTSVPFLTRPSM